MTDTLADDRPILAGAPSPFEAHPLERAGEPLRMRGLPGRPARLLRGA